MSFFNKFKGSGTGTSTTAAKESGKKKEEPPPEPTPLERMLQSAGPVRNDGTDKFFGMENFGNTCYCNSVLQALFYSEAFRDHVVNYPPLIDGPDGVRPKVNVTLRPPMNGNAIPAAQKQADAAQKRRQATSAALVNPQAIRPEDKPDSPEYKKKQVMMKGPILELSHANPTAYGMDECTFTGLKDIFLALIESQERTGVLSPQRFLEIFKRDNEMFRNSMHQDAHEFYGLVLNDIISNVEANAKRTREMELALLKQQEGLSQAGSEALSALSAAALPSTGWVHDIFEGVLTSETKCLTCETASQRDETFLDLSIDLDEHSSVTSCLGKFSAEEMLCERNKFHCDHCGGLQEAEKRMKIHKLPKVLAFHLKRFKYTEDYSRLQKLFHRVVYPYHLRLFNTTDDADDPDRIYELYAVVVHIGGNAYHGHYVSVIKTKDRGWLLFDDEMVEPVDKHFVRNFFGDKPGMACAYVLFYQETTYEKMRAEQEAEGYDDLILRNDKAASSVSVQDGVAADGGLTNGLANGAPLAREATCPPNLEDGDAAVLPSPLPPLAQVRTAPLPGSVSSVLEMVRMPTTPATPTVVVKTREERKRERKEAEAAEKARKQAAKAEAKLQREKSRGGEKSKGRGAGTAVEDEALRRTADDSSRADDKRDDGLAEMRGREATPRNSSSSFLNRTGKGSKSMSKRSFAFLGTGGARDRTEGGPGEAVGAGAGAGEAATNGNEGGVQEQQQQQQQQQQPPPPPPPPSERHEKFKRQFSFGMGRKKSSNVLS